MSGFKCSFCVLWFESQDEIRAHVHSAEHGQKVREANLDSFVQGSTKVAENMSYRCEPCGKRFEGPIPHNQHLASEKHLKKIRSLESSASGNPSLQDGNFLHCEPCGKKFAGQVPYNQHLISERHIKKMRESASESILSIQNPQAPKSSCSVCDISFETPQDLLEHTSSHQHRIRLLQSGDNSGSATKLTQEDREDRNLLISIIANHTRDFLVCPADMSFMDFVLKNKIFS